MSHHIVYIGWVGFGNLGDDLCRDLFAKHLKESAAEEGYDSDQLHITSLYPARFSQADFLRLNPDLVVLGGGSLLGSPYIEAFIQAQMMGIPTIIWGSGIDSLLPPASRIFQPDRAIEDQMKMMVHYSGYAGASLLQSVGNCIVGGVRGPDTFALLDAIGCDVSNLRISGDPGLLLTKDPHHDATAVLPPSYDGRPIVGINWGTARNNIYGEDETKTRAALAQALNAMAHRYHFVLFPMWEHDLPELKKLAQELHRADAMTCWDRVPSAAELAALLGQCTFTINLKLHANVFSAAVGCPFLSIAYRSKCFDFAHAFDWASFVIATDAPNLHEEVIVKCQALHDDAEVLKSRIDHHRRQYVEQLNHLLRQCFQHM